MRFTPLTDAQRASFDADGVLIVRNAIGPNALADFVAAADRLVAANYRETGERRASLTNVVAEEAFLPLLTEAKSRGGGSLSDLRPSALFRSV